MADVTEWGRLIAPVLVSALIAGGISYYGYRQARDLGESQRDANLREKFAAFHFAGDRGHRITPYLLDAMTSPGLKRGLREFIFWEIMARNFKAVTPVTAFDRDHDDWASLGEAAFGLRRDWALARENQSFDDWWCDRRTIILERWPEHAPTIEALYKYLDKYYFDRHPRPLKPCPPLVRG